MYREPTVVAGVTDAPDRRRPHGRATIVRVPALRTVRVTRYVTPLREGGSLPAIVEADDDGLYVLKFRGAGQGAGALIAELVSGEIARALGLPVPELVFAELDPDLARTEPDPEIHALIRASGGLNLALDYLPGSVMFDPVVAEAVVRPGVAHRLVRRLRLERRSDGAQHQHADVAPPSVPHRPRRLTVLPPLARGGRRSRAGVRPVRAHQGTRAPACRQAGRRGRRDDDGGADRRGDRGHRRADPGGWLAERGE